MTNALSLPCVPHVGSKTLISKAFEQFEPAIRFVIDREATPGSNHLLSVVAAVIVKAYYYENHEKLERFLEVLLSGFATGEHEWAAIALRTTIQDKKDLSMSVNYRKTLFLKTQNALKQFLAGNKIQFLKTTTAIRDDYPIPGFCKYPDIQKAESHFKGLG